MMPPHEELAVKLPRKANRRRAIPVAAWLAVPGAIWLLVFTIFPLIFTLIMSFWTSSLFGTTADWNIGNYLRIVSEPIYYQILLTTLRIAAFTTILSLLIAYPIAWFLSNLSPRLKMALLTGLFLPFWVSYIIRTFVWLPILGRNGVINDFLVGVGAIATPIEWLIYSEFALYLGLVYVYFLYMLLPIFMSLERLDRTLFEAAADLGASNLKVFTRVVLPLTMPGVLSGSVMVFLLSCGAFVTPQLLGGPSAAMFGNLIADQFILGNNWAFGAALSIVLVAVVMAFVFAVGRRMGLVTIFLGGR